MSIRDLLNRWGLQPSKGLGQNFLTDDAILEKIAAAAELTPQDVALEIGAGTGTLTQHLARMARRVIAVELDRRMIDILQETLADCDNVDIVQGDILALPIARLIEPATPYTVVANLPYYITSAVLRYLLESDPRPERIVVTVQREVAERIVAQPGDMSILAVSVQFYGYSGMLFSIKPGSFYPSPSVASAVLRIDLYDELPIPQQQVEEFFRVVRAGFSQRRKQLRNALAAGLHLPPQQIERTLHSVGIDPRRRAQTLSVQEWITATRAFTARP